MSGVAAYIGHCPATGARLLDRLAAAQVHRGRLRDTRVDDRLGLTQLAHDNGLPVRLAVDDGCLLALDGCLDNAIELRAELIRAGLWAPGRPGGDAELALVAWRGWREAGLARLAGSFALVIADLAEATLTLVRDELGAVPLYHTVTPPDPDAPPASSAAEAGPTTGPVTLVASDLAALLRTVPTPPAPDDESVRGYLRLGIRPAGEHTFFAGVHRVLPGECVTVAADGAVTRRRYGQLRADLSRRDRSSRPVDAAARDLVGAELRRALRQRLTGPEPVGVPAALAELAAGQSAVSTAELAAGQSVVPRAELVAGQSVVPQAESAAELAAGQSVLAPPGPVPAERLPEAVAEVVAAYPEPLSGPAGLAAYRALSSAAQRVAVLVDTTGDRALRVEDAAAPAVRASEFWRRRRIGALARQLAGHPVSSVRLVGTVLGPHVQRPDRPERDPAEELLIRPAPLAGPSPDRAARRTSRRDRVLDGLPAAFEFTDRVAALLGLTLRRPLLDAELLRTLWSFDPIPSALPPAGPTDRRSAGRELADWLDALDELLVDTFTAASFGNRGYFRQDAVVRAYRAHRAGVGTVEPALLWRMASVELWLRQWADQCALAPREVSPVHPGRERVSPDGDWARYPLRLAPLAAGTDLAVEAVDACREFFDRLTGPDRELLDHQRWYLYVSGTAVAVTQGRTVPARGIRVGRRARALARLDRVSAPAAGLAVREVGPVRQLAAVVASAAGRTLGRPGWARSFAPGLLVSRDPRADAVPPANTDVLLPPHDPVAVAVRLSRALRAALPAGLVDAFGGTVVICADDRRRVVLGHDTEHEPDELAAACVDNPLGQSREHTPIAVVGDLRPAARLIDWAALDADKSDRLWPATELTGFGGFQWERDEVRTFHPPWRPRVLTLR